MQFLAAQPTKGERMKKPELVLVIGLLTLFSLNSTVYAQDNTIIDLVNKKATEHSVPVALAQAIVKIESNYNPKVRGQLGEYGLGQIRCSTAKSMGFTGKCDSLLDPETNLEYSMLYIKLALDKSNNDVCGAANFYSSGIENFSKKTKYCREVLKQL